jgi:2'-hydroxyisoflavone reductase
MTTRRRFLHDVTAAAGMLGLSPLLVPSVAEASVTSAPQRVLILGGTGFLGPHLVHVLTQRGHRVSMLNRGRREPGLFEEDYRNVESIQGDRATPTGLDGLKGKTWDVVIETSGYRHPWTRDSGQALKGSVGRYVYVSSTGVYWPYRTVDIDENGTVPLRDDPPADPPTYGVMKALSENEVRGAFGDKALIVRPGYIVGPGDTSDRWTYWPVRVMRGGEIMVPGKPDDQVQYVDVRDLSEWMVTLIENGTNGTFNVVGPARKQTMREFVFGLAALTSAPLSWVFIDDNEFLKKYPLRTLPNNGGTQGMFEAVPWIMPEPTELGHMRIRNDRALAAGLKFRPLAVTAMDTVAWRQSADVPEALRNQPRYVMNEQQERELIAAWKARR